MNSLSIYFTQNTFSKIDRCFALFRGRNNNDSIDAKFWVWFECMNCLQCENHNLMVMAIGMGEWCNDGVQCLFRASSPTFCIARKKNLSFVQEWEFISYECGICVIWGWSVYVYNTIAYIHIHIQTLFFYTWIWVPFGKLR